MMALEAMFIVTWEAPVGSHTHPVSLRVAQSRLEAFLGVLVANGVESISAKKYEMAL
jgi:hypothetical protein